MDIRLHFSRRIDASHEGTSVPDECGDHLHGHTFEAEFDFMYDPLGDMTSPRPWVDRLIEEIDNRSLNDMIKPSIPSTYGLAMWLMHRLAQNTRIERVKVWNGDVGVSVTNDNIRRK